MYNNFLKIEGHKNSNRIQVIRIKEEVLEKLIFPIFFKSFLSSLLFSSLFIEPLKQEFRKELIIGLLVSGSLCAVILFSPSATFDDVTGFYIFISGFIAISALVVPGISGSFIIVLLGSYPFLIEAVSNLDVFRISYFLVGALLGLFTIVRVIRKFYEENEKFIFCKKQTANDNFYNLGYDSSIC